MRAERDLVRHCHTDLDVDALQRQVLRSLRRLMPVDAAFIATADPETLLFTGMHIEEPLSAAASLFLDNEFGGRDVNRFAELAKATRHVGSLDAATRADRAASGRYRDIMAPLGLGDELRAALTVDTECWGYLCLHRADHPTGFTAAEAAIVARVAPHIAQALRRATMLAVPGAAEPGPPGVVLLADDLTLVAGTAAADDLLARVAPDNATTLPLPAAAYAAAAALVQVERGTAPPEVVPTGRIRTRDGHWLTVHASRLLAGEPHIALVIEAARPRPATPALLAAHGLTPREAEVARLVLRGESTRAISDTLHISTHTVQDHLKSVFDKVGVRSRRELVGVLLGGRPAS